MADGGPADRLRSPKKDDGERVRQTIWDDKKLARVSGCRCDIFSKILLF
jgi:hypothetical protein